MIKSESVVTADIAKHFKTSNNLESSCKKISRIFNSKLIDYDSLYEVSYEILLTKLNSNMTKYIFV